MAPAHPKSLRDERGMALVIALLVLLVLSLLATVLLVSVNVENKITGHGLRETSALNVAEAGIGEAQARLADGTLTAALNEDPLKVTQIFNAPAGSVPVPGADTTGFATAQPAGAWLPYSQANRGPGVLTIEYKTNDARTAIYRYDHNQNPPVGTYVDGYPIYKITSTGTVGGDHRTVQTEIYTTPVPAEVMGAVVSNVSVKLGGNINICGLNHKATMPNNALDDPSYHTGDGDKYGVWGTTNVSGTGSYKVDGDPYGMAGNQVGPYIDENPPTGFYLGPWNVFGMTPSQFWNWIGPPVTAPPDPPNGLVYIAGDAAYHSATGEGVLYVTGDLTINAGFTYRGLIYVEGDLNINGHAWILGGIVVKGNTELKIANGTADVYYSSEMISQAASQAAGNFTRLSWRELPQ